MTEYPLAKAFMLLEPGPVVLVTTSGEKHPNVMTLTWTMVLDWSPRIALCTGAWNYTFQSMMKNQECVIAIPTADLAETVLKVGTCSSRDTDKFAQFGLTAMPAAKVKAPLIQECYANLECQVVDYLEEYGIVILEGVKAWINSQDKAPKFFHAVGDGRFTVDGETLNLRALMLNKLPPGV